MHTCIANCNKRRPFSLIYLTINLVMQKTLHSNTNRLLYNSQHRVDISQLNITFV